MKEILYNPQDPLLKYQGELKSFRGKDYEVFPWALPETMSVNITKSYTEIEFGYQYSATYSTSIRPAFKVFSLELKTTRKFYPAIESYLQDKLTTGEAFFIRATEQNETVDYFVRVDTYNRSNIGKGIFSIAVSFKEAS